jgi:DNA-binding CsgD family transcriptional regulator
MDLFIGHTLGVLALGSGDPVSAIAALERVSRLRVARETRDQAIVPWAFDLVEAYARAGRSAAAAELLGRYATSADDYVGGLTERSLGLLAPREEMAAHFERALDAHERCGMPFERARTALVFGERLRRSRSRGAAREQLSIAEDIFQLVDAGSWLERVRAEIAAAGGLSAGTRVDAGRGTPPWAGSLTPQELQVAMVVAGGASNQEAASSLFLSPKTIEYHLSNIYRKANLRSRNELSVLV